MLLDEATRQRAANAQDALDKLASAAWLVGLICAAIPMLAPSVPMMALIGGFGKFAADRRKQVADDPPRPDFEAPDEVYRHPLRDVLGSTRTERQAFNFVHALVEASANLEAMVVAHERAQGAAEAGRPDHAQRHMEAAHFLGLRAWQSLVGVEDAVGADEEGGFMNSISEFEAGLAEQAEEPITNITVPSRLPASFLIPMRAAGLGPAEFTIIGAPKEPVSDVAELFRVVGEREGELGRAIRDELLRATGPSQ